MCVVLADVSGKGVPAAVFVSNTRAMLRAVARAPSTPGSVLATVSEMVRLDGQGDLYVTGFVAMVDTARHTMVYANAGHPPGIILRGQGGTRALDVGGPPLGLVPEATYDEEHITLEPGDLVVLVSDGITDAIGATGPGIPGAIAAELVPRRRTTPEAACEALLQAARQPRGPYEGSAATWADDRTVVAFTFSPNPTD
jgi:sigma-B regulation protein RsbU (phosphoserine phosphatase)